MGRRLDYIVRFDAPSEKIYQDFTSRQYAEALMDAYRQLTPQSEITRFCCDDTGTHIVFTQNLPRAYLPPIARTVMPVDMIITREQHFEPYDHTRNRARGTYRASIPAGPGHFGGKYFLTDTHDGKPVAAGQRLQGLDPVRRRKAGRPDIDRDHAAVRRRRGVHRRLDLQAPLAAGC
jgi:Protein of unknown function (DUF2505)